MDNSTLPLTPEATSDLVNQALSLWGLESCRASVIRHNENLACRVERDGSTYLLRICLPRTSGWIGLQQDPDALRSELTWMRAVSQGTGLTLQEPVQSHRGEDLEVVRHPLTGREVPCMLLKWLDGDMFSQKEQNAENLAREFGRVQAAFHAHSKSWQPPSGFRRLVYDEAMLASALPELEQGVFAGIVRREDLEMVIQACAKITRLMRSLPRTPDNWGMIHADWVGNLVVLDEPAELRCASAQDFGANTAFLQAAKLVPIDFSLSGFGYYATDMAIGVSNLKKHLRPAYLEGYGADLSDEDKYNISAFILMMIFVAAGKNVFNPAWRDWFQPRRMPVIAQEHCRQLLRGEPFLLDI